MGKVKAVWSKENNNKLYQLRCEADTPNPDPCSHQMEPLTQACGYLTLCQGQERRARFLWSTDVVRKLDWSRKLGTYNLKLNLK